MRVSPPPSLDVIPAGPAGATGVLDLPGAPHAWSDRRTRSFSPPRRARSLFGAVLLGASFPTLHAAEPALAPALSQYRQRAWTQENGLPAAPVQGICQTHDGYLWLGTQEGLARFDGAAFTVFNRANTPALPSNYVTDLREDARGQLWIGTAAGLVCRSAAGQFRVWTSAEGLAADYVRSLAIARDGTVWVGHAQAGVDRLREGRVVPCPELAPLARETVWCVREDAAGALWFGTVGAGAWRYREARLERFGPERGLPDPWVTALELDARGRLWAATYRGVACFEGESFRSVPGAAAPALSGLPVFALLADRAGRLWLGTLNHGLGRLDPDSGRLELFRPREGPLRRELGRLYEDREGSVWVSGGGGVVQLTAGKFVTFGEPEGLEEPDVRVTAPDLVSGDVWLGTLRGLVRWRPGGGGEGSDAGLRSVPEFAQRRVTTLQVDRRRALWVGTDDGKLFVGPAGPNGGGGGDREEVRSWRECVLPPLMPAGVPVGFLTALAEDARTDQLWVGSIRGLLRLDRDAAAAGEPREVASFGPEQGLDGGVHALLVDRAGTLWAGTKHGLAWLDPGETRFRAFTVQTTPGWPNDGVRCLCEDPAAGTLWVGTLGGVTRVKDGRAAPRACTSREGLPSDIIYQILADDLGSLWMSSGRGVFRVAAAELAAFFDGRRERVEATVYNAADGLRSAETNGGTQPAGCRDAAGRLWFPTLEGASVVDPAHLPLNQVPPAVWLEGVLVNRRQAPAAAAATFAPGSRWLEFTYTAPCLTAPEKVRFRYRLEGFDAGWVDAGTRRSAEYTNLAPGRYRFQVVAANNDGVWNMAGAALTFRLRPYFYQTRWFAGLSLAAAAGSAWALFRWRQRLLRARLRAGYEAALAERLRLAGELHDTAAQGLVAVRLLLDRALREEAVAVPGARATLERARFVAGQSLTEARAWIARLRGQAGVARPGNVVDLPAELARVCQEMRGRTETEIIFCADPGPVSWEALDAEVGQQLVRICQEAIQNALRHAAARRIQVSVGAAPAAGGGTGEHLRCEVRDDGCGFEVGSRAGAADQGHFGLVGMSERAGHIGGRLQVRSAPGEGTTVTVEIPRRRLRRAHGAEQEADKLKQALSAR